MRRLGLDSYWGGGRVGRDGFCVFWFVYVMFCEEAGWETNFLHGFLENSVYIASADSLDSSSIVICLGFEESSVERFFFLLDLRRMPRRIKAPPQLILLYFVMLFTLCWPSASFWLSRGEKVLVESPSFYPVNLIITLRRMSLLSGVRGGSLLLFSDCFSLPLLRVGSFAWRSCWFRFSCLLWYARKTFWRHIAWSGNRIIFSFWGSSSGKVTKLFTIII